MRDFIHIKECINMRGYENSRIPRLFEILDERNLKAKDITNATGIGSGSISDWKSGKSVPTGERLLAVAEFLNVPADYLLGSIDSLPEPQKNDENSEMSERDIINARNIEKLVSGYNQLPDEQKEDVIQYIEFIGRKHRRTVEVVNSEDEADDSTTHEANTTRLTRTSTFSRRLAKPARRRSGLARACMKQSSSSKKKHAKPL